MAIMLEERDSLMHSIPCCNVPGMIHILYESSHSQVFSSILEHLHGLIHSIVVKISLKNCCRVLVFGLEFFCDLPPVLTNFLSSPENPSTAFVPQRFLTEFIFYAC